MNTFQQNAQAAKSYQGNHAQAASGNEHGLPANYYLQKVAQHNRTTSDGAINLQIQQVQAKDLANNMDRQQYQQNDRKVPQSKDGAAVSLQQQVNEQRKYSLQLNLQDPVGVRGSSQQHNLNLTQIDYSSQQYGYAGHGLGSNTTKNEQLKNQKGIDFAGASASQHGQTQEVYLKALPKHAAGKGDGAGRHQSAPRSGRGDEAGTSSNAQAAARDRTAHQKQELNRQQQPPHTASGGLRGQQHVQGQGTVATNSAELNAGSNPSSAAIQGHHRKQSHHVGQYQKIDNIRLHQAQLNQSQQIQHGNWIDKDGKVYQAIDDEPKKKAHQGSKRLMNNASGNQATAGSENIAVDGHEFQKGVDGKVQMDDQTIQPNKQARVNGNTFKNYNGKKIISIQNSYQKAQIQKNQHNSSNSGIQQQKSGSGGNHNRKRSEKENMKAGPVSTTSYQKAHARHQQQEKVGDHQGQTGTADHEEDGEAQANQQNDNAGGGAPGAQSLVCQVPQNQVSNLQQMQKMLQLQQQQLRAQAGFAQGQYQQEQEWLIGPQAKNDVGRKTLVLDLDETLVHSQFKPVEGADIVLPVEIEGQIWEIYILVRPGVSEFLHRMAKHYELVVFTASLSKYAEPLVAQLDPDGFCTYKLFREHCTQFNNAFVKDLTRLGRPMTDVIIVDNSPIAYLWQPENAIPCTSWYDDMSDTELDRIATILEKLAYEDDVRRVIRKIIKNNQIDDRAEQIYLKSHKRDHSQRPADNRRSHVDPTSENVIVINGMRPGTTAKQGEQQQPGAMMQQHQSQRDKADQQRAGGAHHQRYESADNKQKYQAIVNEKLRKKNELAEQFSMNDAANYEQVLRMMHESGQVARHSKAPATASDGSNRKNGRRMQDPIVQMNKEKNLPQGKGEQKMTAHRGSGSNGTHGYGPPGQADQQRQAQYQDREGNFAQKRSLEAHGGNQNSTRATNSRHGGNGPAPLMGDKKMQDMYQQQHLQLNYHPQTTKGTTSQTQQFNFENQGQKMRIRDRQGSQHITVSQSGHQSQGQNTPAAKRAASVKNQNNAQILREQQQILAAQQAQLNKAQQAHNRSRVYSAGSSNQPNQMSNHGAKGKIGQPGQAGSGAHQRTAHTAGNAATAGGQIRPAIGAQGQPQISAAVNHPSVSYHRKKGQVGDHQAHQSTIQSSSAAQKLQKSHSQNRQASGQRASAEQNQNNAAPRAQSSGNRPGVVGPNGMRGAKEQNYQNAQRAQIHNYFSNNVPPQPQGSHAFVSKNGQIQFDKTAEYVAQRGARSSAAANSAVNNAQKPVKQNLKDYSQPAKQADGQTRTGNGLGVKIGLQTQYGLQHGVGSGSTVNSTKAAKKQGLAEGSVGNYPSSNAGGHQLASQYSHRGEELGFLSKLTQQNMQSQQQAERREGDQGQPQASNRALQAMYLAGGVGAHAPHGVQISLNSPKYGQALNFMGHGAPNNPSSPTAGTTGDSYHFQNDSSNSQFNRTGPIILNNRTSIADAHFYHQLGVGGPISTKNSNMNHATKAVHPGNNAGKDPLMKHGHSRSNRNTSSSHNPYHTQGIGGHTQLVSNSMNLETHQQQRTMQGHDGSGGMKLKLSKKQKSTTIEPQNPMIQNPPKTAPSGHSAIQLNRQIDYQSKQHGAPKYLQQNRSHQAQAQHQQSSSSQHQSSTTKAATMMPEGSSSTQQQQYAPAAHKSGPTRQASIGGKKSVSSSMQYQMNSFQGQHINSGGYAGSSTNI